MSALLPSLSDEDRTKLLAYLTEVRAQVKKDQELMNTQQKRIDTLQKALSEAVDGLKQVRRAVLVESASRSSPEFRTELRSQLNDLRNEFVKVGKSQSKVEKFFGEDVKQN